MNIKWLKKKKLKKIERKTHFLFYLYKGFIINLIYIFIGKNKERNKQNFLYYHWKILNYMCNLCYILYMLDLLYILHLKKKKLLYIKFSKSIDLFDIIENAMKLKNKGLEKSQYKMYSWKNECCESCFIFFQLIKFFHSDNLSLNLTVLKCFFVY